jgi:hypothetical protein
MAALAVWAAGFRIRSGGVAQDRMVRVLLLAFGLIVMSTCLQAQTATPNQSLRPTQGACTAGSQSVRVCNNDLQSCNDVCAAKALDVNADIAGCTTACCYNYNVCLRMRQCGSRVIQCN